MEAKRRQQEFLRKIAQYDSGELSNAWYGRSTFICLLAAGDAEKANEWMLKKVQEVNQRIDCSDFRLNLLFRAMLLFPRKVRPEVKQAIKEAALATRYYGGYSRDYPMFCSSENHHMNWAVAEHLAAQLWPDEVFSYDGRTSRQHRDRARFLIANWIDLRARWGYDEWNSSCYMGINLLSLLNLADFADEPVLRRLAHDSVTRLLADLAADSAYGGVWAAQARLYEGQCFHRAAQNVAPALTILLGAGRVEDLRSSEACGDAVATTSYRAPDWLCRLACDLDEPLVNLERHRNEHGIYYKARSCFWRPPLELIDEAWRQKLCPEYLTETPIRTERTKEYIVSSAIYGAGGNIAAEGHQAMTWMGCLKGRVPVFTTHPSHQPGNYWTGAASSPRSCLQDGVLAVVYHGPGRTQAADFTHACFPTGDLNEWKRQGDWFFGRCEDAYVGLLAPKEATLTAEGPWAGKEIKAPGRTAAWAAIFGGLSRDGDFGAFIARCQSSRIAFRDETATVEVTAGKVNFSVSHASGAVVAGKPFSCGSWRQLDNACVQSDFGSPITHIQTGQGRETLDFSGAQELARQWERPE